MERRLTKYDGVRILLASTGLDPHLFGTHSLCRTKGSSFYGRPAISRTLLEADAAHINFEINTDDPSCEAISQIPLGQSSPY